MSVLTEGQHAGEFIVSEANKTRSREAVTVLSGQDLEAGEVVGKVLMGVGKADIPTVSGTGDGTMSALYAGPDVESGDYVVTCTETETHGGTFSVVTPSGDALPDLELDAGSGNSTEYTSSHINFTITDGGTDFAADDSFTITVESGNPTVVGTGDGTLTSLALKPASKTGRYRVECIEAGTNTGTFRVTDPEGLSLGSFIIPAGAGNTIDFDFAALGGTITDGGTDFAVGDFFEVFVWNEAGKVVEWTPGTYDGRHMAAGVLYEAVDASSADTDGVIIVRDAEVNWGELQWASGITAAEKEVAKTHLKEKGIIAL